MKRALAIVAGVILGLIGLVAMAVFIFTNTDYGRERVRRFAVGKLNGVVHGHFRVGGIRGNLLGGLVLTDVSITDSSGAPFLSADEVSTRYALRTFLSKRIVLNDLRLVRPVVVLDRAPEGSWNWERIFPRDTLKKVKTGPGFGDWIALNDVRMINGHVVVRTPWTPGDSLTGAQRDSAVAVALGGESRKRVERVPGGFQQVMEFRQISGEFPRLRIADPDTSEMLIRVATARLLAEPFRPPAADVRDVRGDFLVAKDSLYWRDVRAALAASRVSALSGTYFLAGTGSHSNGDMWLRLNGEQVALADLRWLYPPVPAEGGGSLQFALVIAGDSSDYVARDASIRTGGATLAGDFGLALGDTVRFHDTDLRFSGIDTRLIEQLAPSARIPRRGTLGGRAALAGSMGALRVDADVAFDDVRAGTSRVAAVGELGFAGGFRARGLRVRAYPLQVDLARIAAPTLPVGGTITGVATLDGSTSRWLVGSADLVHQDRGAVSHVIGRGEITMGARKYLEVDVRTVPLSLATVGRFVPALGLRGSASGLIRARGPFSNLVLRGDLRMPGGGALAAGGRLDLVSREIGYDLTTRMRLFNANAVLARAPRTSLTAVATARGRGFDPATMRATFAADLARSAFDSVSFDSVHARVAIADGVARVDSLSVRSPFAFANVDGTFGMAPGRDGELVYHVRVDSLSGFRRWIGGLADTGLVAPRPERQARRIARAREDSAAVAKATEVERAALGTPGPTLKVDSIASIRRDSLAGTLYTAGTIRGGLSRFSVRGRAGVDSVVVRGNAVETGRVEYALTNGGTPQMSVALGASFREVQVGGFDLDSADVRAAYAKPRGRLELAVVQETAHHEQRQELVTKTNFVLHPDHNELHIADLRLTFDTTTWASARPGAVQWGPRGIELKDIELRSGPQGRIYADGLLPTEGAMNLRFDVTGFQIAHLVALLQGGVAATGVVSVAARAEGTRAAPRVRGALGVVDVSYRGTAVPDVRATIQYADAALTAHADLVRGVGRPVAVMDARLPINLALAGYTGPRFLDRPLTFDMVADSLPLDVLPKFTDAISNIHGRVIGKLSLRGTKARPTGVGALALDLGSLRVVSTGVTWRDLTGAIRIRGDTLMIDSLYARSGGGHGGIARITGGLSLKELTRPGFDLRIAAEDALVLDNDMGTIHADARAQVEGPFNAVRISGRANVLHGVVYVPEPDSRTAVSSSDPAVFSVIDTSLVTNRAIVQQQSELTENMRIDMRLTIQRGTFARSSEGNIEVFTPEDIGPLRVNLDRRSSALRLEGMVATDRGEYTVAGRRFTITRGSATFIGAAEVDPLIQILGEHQVDLPGQEALQIQVIIGGTARNPRLTLSSNSQPPISQTDLLSYLTFGRSSSSLLQAQGSSVSGQSTGSGKLAGTVAALAARQMAAVALGAVVSESKTGLARSLGADVFNITPADIPAELSSQGFASLLQGTEVEAGKYVSTQTFIAGQLRLSAAVPGLRFEHRMPKGLRVEATFEPRYLLRAPSLSTVQAPTSTGVFGSFLILERRF